MVRKKIGLALSGGGARGFAHIGVLKVLVENDIPIDMIAGTSAGSIIGGCFASGMTIGEIEEMASHVGYVNMMRPSIGIGGMFSNAPMGRFLTRNLPVQRFDELKLPFAATAFDLGSSELVVLNGGDLVPAIRASCAVPGVFDPVRDDRGRLLVDGGVVSPMPVDTVKAMGADIVIAVDLLACGSTFRTNSRTGLGIMIQAALSLLQVAAAREGENADIVIEPAIAHLRPDQIKKREEFITLGIEAATARIDEIKRLAAEQISDDNH